MKPEHEKERHTQKKKENITRVLPKINKLLCETVKESMDGGEKERSDRDGLGIF